MLSKLAVAAGPCESDASGAPLPKGLAHHEARALAAAGHDKHGSTAGTTKHRH